MILVQSRAYAEITQVAFESLDVPDGRPLSGSKVDQRRAHVACSSFDDTRRKASEMRAKAAEKGETRERDLPRK